MERISAAGRCEFFGRRFAAALRDSAATPAAVIGGGLGQASAASSPRPPEALTTLPEPVRPLARATISLPEPPLSRDHRLSLQPSGQAAALHLRQNPLRR